MNFRHFRSFIKKRFIFSDGILVLYIFFTLSALALGYVVYLRIKNGDPKSWSTTTATIESSSFHPRMIFSYQSSTSQSIDCSFEYFFTVNSKAYHQKRVVSLVEGDQTRFAIGQKIQVRYNPKDPNVQQVIDDRLPVEGYGYNGDIISFAVLLIFLILAIFQKRRDKKSSFSVTTRRDETENFPWEELFKKADDTVRELINSLPEELQVHAKKIPYILEKWCPSPKNTETLVLGTYHGFASRRLSDQYGPIFLYLGAIYKYCSQNNKNFEKEVRTTWLHEFGHYVGWDEDKVRAHDL